jgi:hypothetical protein
LPSGKKVRSKLERADERTRIVKWISFSSHEFQRGRILYLIGQKRQDSLAFLGLDLVGPEELPGGYRVDCD